MVIENKICQLSEYNRAFKAKTFVCASSIYDSNVDYRLQRREAEHFHQTDAFTWDVIDGETDSDEGCGKRRLPLCLLHRYKHRKFNKAYRVAHRSDPLPHTRETESGRERRATVATSHQSDCDKTQQASRDRAVQTPDWADVKLQAPIHADGTRNEQPSSKEAGCQVSVSRTSGAEDCSTRKVMPQCAVGKPPFVAYGHVDEHRDTGKQQTHNIRAATSVYPSALRAMRRKQVEANQKARYKSVQQNLRHYDLVREFNRKMDEDTACWQTEYGSHYPRYDSLEYQRPRTPQVPIHRTPAAFFVPM